MGLADHEAARRTRNAHGKQVFGTHLQEVLGLGDTNAEQNIHIDLVLIACRVKRP